MKKVEVYSDWCYYDTLDGEVLKDGETLTIRWPDGSHSEEKVLVKKSHMDYQDHGHPTQIPISEAFILVPFKGTMARIRLCEENLLCERK